MFRTASDVIEYVNDNDVKFVRLAFCDIFGNQKNISIMASRLTRAFESGVSFDASAIKGFGMEERSDLFLFPDPFTFSVLPWRPTHGRVVRLFCDIRYPDGRAFELDGRQLLKNTVAKVKNAGYNCCMGSECEFYLFKTDDNGEPTREPFDNGGYLDIFPADKGENVRREICLTLEEMGIPLESSHHEEGPGQNEIDVRHSGALSSADNVTTYRSVVRTIAERNGLYASFAPKPLRDEAGNGMHINLSVRKLGEDKTDKDLFMSFMAGVMEHIPEMTAFLNPTPESYERLGCFKAPKYVSWSQENHSQLIRIPAGEERSKFELRSPDCTANPYLAYALLMEAGIDGMKRKLTPDAALNTDLENAPEAVVSKLKRLPESIAEALNAAEGSSFITSVVSDKIIRAYRNR